MTIIPRWQIDEMVPVMDTILKYPTKTIGEIRKEFNLTSEEFDMIYELCMPLVRENNVKKYWAVKYKHVSKKIKNLLANERVNNKKFREEVKALFYTQSPGEALMYEACGLTGDETIEDIEPDEETA